MRRQADSVDMGCNESPQVRDFLAGNLSREATLSTLDHVRECDDCRSVMTAESRLGAANVRPEASDRVNVPAAKELAAGEDGQLHVNPWRSPTEGFSSYGGQRQSWFRRGPMIRMAVLGLGIAMLFNARNYFTGPKEGPPSTLELQISGAIEAGRPYCDSPEGDISSRPKVMSVTIPPGEKKFRVLVMKSGATVFEREIKQGAEGVYFEARDVRRASGTIPAREVLFPFPDAKALPLENETEYFWFVILPNGNQSAPVALRLD